MSQLKIFISSTFCDLGQERKDLDGFIRGLGHDPVRHENGSITYGSEQELEQYCYKAINECEILISIIGGRFGTTSYDEKYSISQMELKVARQNNKLVYIFIKSDVHTEYNTYLKNKNNAWNYSTVDDERIFSFIEEIQNSKLNKNIQPFFDRQEIENYLKQQLSGHLKNYFANQCGRFRELKTESREIPNKKSKSDLKYLFFNVTDCDKTRSIIKEYFGKNKDSICGLYDLYGRHDVLLKYRHNEKLSSEINARLKKEDLFTDKEDDYQGRKDITIVTEYYNWLENNTNYKILKSKEPNSTWNCCFLRVFVDDRKTGNISCNEFLEDLKENILQSDENIKNIIRHVCIEANEKSVIFDLLLSCQQFLLLHKLTRCIEHIIDKNDLRTDKHTHIVYYHEERQP